MTSHPLATVTTLLAALALAGSASAAAQASGPCARFASPAGSDADPGTRAAPLRSIGKLVMTLAPGEDGCLPNGARFDEPLGTFIVSGGGGEPGRPVTVRSEDPGGAPARIRSSMWLKAATHDIAFEHLAFLDSPTNDRGTMLVIHGDRIALRDDELSFPRGICLNVGQRDGYTAGDTAETARSDDFVLERSRVHGCGTAEVDAMRQRGQSGVHGVYLVNTARAVIRDDLVYDNLDRGVQLWPDADDTLIERNVIDGNGSNVNIGSSAGYGHFSEGTIVRANLITNAVLRSVYDQPWGPGDIASIVGNFPADGLSHGNLVTANCILQSDPALAFDGPGFTQSANTFADPGYANRATRDFTIAPGSPCAGDGPSGPPAPAEAAPDPAPTPAPAPAPASTPAPAATPSAPTVAAPTVPAHAPAVRPAPARRAIARPVSRRRAPASSGRARTRACRAASPGASRRCARHRCRVARARARARHRRPHRCGGRPR